MVKRRATGVILHLASVVVRLTPKTDKEAGKMFSELMCLISMFYFFFYNNH